MATQIHKIDPVTPDLTQENISKIAQLFPDVVTETADKNGKLTRAVDFNALKADLTESLGDTRTIDDNRERYEFAWPGKALANEEARRPIDKTLRPCKGLSKNWDKTQNVYIEGDNLEALKLMHETYAGKIKMIYIDPPYNTGHDFIYQDDFTLKSEDYKKQSSDFDDEGNRMKANPDTNGRFHSDWCSMMYPRLKLASDLLTPDGAVFISIDDHEDANLRKICDEIFGAPNFIAQLIWRAGRKNDSHFISVSHEYVLIYAKNMSYLNEHKIKWREKKQGLDEIYSEYESLKQQYGTDYQGMGKALSAWYKTLPASDPAKDSDQYNKVDANGIYFAGDISWPGGGGPTYTVLHPVTHKPVAVPSRGWIFPKPERMQEMIDKGYVEFGPDEKKVPTFKRYLKDHEYQAPYSVFYQDGRAATKRLRTLMGGSYFDHPKDETILADFISFICTNGDETVLDFFSGSATTAHAMMDLNAKDGGHRKFIMVQVPEKIDSKAVAFKAGYHTICEIGEERIRRAGKKIEDEVHSHNKQLELGEEPRQVPDTGFRVFRIESSNFKDVSKTPEEMDQLHLDVDVDNIKGDRTPDDLLFQILPLYDLPYSVDIKEETIEGAHVYNVHDNQLLACLDDAVTEATIKQMALRKPVYVVFCDKTVKDDPLRSTLEKLFTTLSPETTVEVI